MAEGYLLQHSSALRKRQCTPSHRGERPRTAPQSLPPGGVSSLYREINSEIISQFTARVGSAQRKLSYLTQTSSPSLWPDELRTSAALWRVQRSPPGGWWILGYLPGMWLSWWHQHHWGGTCSHKVYTLSADWFVFTNIFCIDTPVMSISYGLRSSVQKPGAPQRVSLHM